MKPFKYTTVAAKLIGPYPLPDDVHALVHERIEIQSDSFVRLWLSEGIPYAFQSCPILYQVSREWIANRVGVSPNEIGIVGSAKLGYSLRPTPDFRKLFHPKSDLDYVIVSGALFEKCAEISLRFVEDYESGAISPRTEGQKRCWSEDVEFIKRNIPNGFVNSGKVPNFEKYEGLRRIEQDFWVLSEKLKTTENCPHFSKATFRIYKEYRSFVARASLNLRSALLKST